MRRRDFLFGLLAASAASAAQAAGSGKIFRIAVAAQQIPVVEIDGIWKPFFSELRRLGYVEGDNLVVLRSLPRVTLRASITSLGT